MSQIRNQPTYAGVYILLFTITRRRNNEDTTVTRLAKDRTTIPPTTVDPSLVRLSHQTVFMDIIPIYLITLVSLLH